MLRRLFLLAALALSTPALAVELGDDGLHKPAWLRETFKDLRDDLAEANAEGKRLMLVYEQRGCIYCTKMHEEVFVHLAIEKLLTEDFYVVQMNLFGSVEVTVTLESLAAPRSSSAAHVCEKSSGLATASRS